MAKDAPKILFLCGYIQPFLLSGTRFLIEDHRAEVLMICWPAPAAFPVKTEELPGLRIREKKDNMAVLQQEIATFDPDIIYCAGWMDKWYLQLAQKFKKSGKKVVMGMDTQWTGSPRQRIHCLLAPWTLHNKFTHAWIPGYFQYEYARRLGFPRQKILSQLLAPDTQKFIEAYHRYKDQKDISFPKTFLYVGNLSENKFGKLLAAFTALGDEDKNGWKLIVAGDGPLKDHPGMNTSDIIYKSFVQPDKLPELVKEGGVLCLLSEVEAWGTVIQEFGSAGMPLLLSEACGAHFSFLIDHYNGLLCMENTVASIKEKMKVITHLHSNILSEMGHRSHQLASAGSSASWAGSLMSVL